MIFAIFTKVCSVFCYFRHAFLLSLKITILHGIASGPNQGMHGCLNNTVLINCQRLPNTAFYHCG